jgi:hypothetical protein
MKRNQILNLYGAVIDILTVLRGELDSREDGFDTINLAILELCKLHDWYLTMEDWD